MKMEISIEEKARRYDEAYKKVAVRFGSNVADEIFPELKESEDERIRKALIKLVHDTTGDSLWVDYNVHKEDALAWLEKQGEKDEKILVLKDQIESLHAAINAIKETHRIELEKHNLIMAKSPQLGEQKPADIRTTGYWNVQEVEQKSADKPKFKVGDWVISPNGVYWHIDAIRNGRYEVTADAGQCGNWQLGTNIYRLWTIQDAKDGDVIYCKSSGIEYIVMSKGVNEHGNIDSYFRYNSLDGFGVDVPSVLSTRQDNITPATKEQHDLLFQKMKEAGYEWCEEKKELKKVEQKPAWSEEDENRVNRLIAYFEDKESFTAEDDIVYANWLKSLKDRVFPQPKQEWSEEDERIYQSIMDDTVQENQLNDKQTNWLRDIKYRYFPQPKQEWSEKDEMMVSAINQIIVETKEINGWNCSHIDCGNVFYEDIKTWLKSLKDRVQPKQEWSEDTQQWIDAIIFDYESWYDADKDHRTTIQAKINILKSLKDRYTWKPSDEQLRQLELAIDYWQPNNTEVTTPLFKLWEDLKKLKAGKL